MRHHVKKRSFGRVRRQRTALLRGLACSLILHGKIETTEARAKELRPFIERLVTKAKTDTVVSRRLITSRLGNGKLEARKLVNEIAPKYKDRNGGYTRISKLPVRSSDGAPQAIIEFV